MRHGVGPYCAQRSETTCSGRQVIPNDVSNVWRFAKSPIEFGAELTDARIARFADDSEAAVADISGSILKLRVVEDVEEFNPEIERVILMNHGSLREAEIGVVETRAVEEPAVGSAESP